MRRKMYLYPTPLSRDWKGCDGGGEHRFLPLGEVKALPTASQLRGIRSGGLEAFKDRHGRRVWTMYGVHR